MLHKAALILFLFTVILRADVTVSTAQYGNTRTGANTAETTITVANVANIHKLGSWTIDTYSYGQPLVICGVNISGASCVLVVVTMGSSAYVFNANAPGTAAIWSKKLGQELDQGDYPFITDFYHAGIGCLATPVVDTATNVIYAACVTQASGWQLFSWNLADGTNFHAPVTIAGTNNGVTFASANHMCRPALGLFNGNVIISCSGYGDTNPYQGWMFSYNATTLTQTAAWAVTSTANGEGGIWMSGGGPAFDGTNIYVSTGNGSISGTNYSNAIVKLTQLLAPVDYVTPSDWSTVLNANDKDLNSSHVILSGNYVIAGGKTGEIYVADKSGSSTMGQLEGVGAGPHQKSNLANGANFGCMVLGNNVLFLAGLNTTMKAFSWDSGTGLFNTTPVAFGGSYASPGPGCSYSSNGSTAGTAILWGVTTALSSFSSIRAGTLRAWNTSGLGELYNSDTEAGDVLGNSSKFSPPTVANGKVYVSTFSNAIVVYGFPPASSTTISGKSTFSGKVSIQ